MRLIQGHPNNVLCVNDDPLLTDLLSFALTREGFAVKIVNRGSQAMQSVHTEPPDVIVLDDKVPDADTLSLCRQLRAIARIPVILLSSRQSVDDMVEGFRHGADDYLVKPFDMRVLLFRLRSILRHISAGRMPLDNSARSYPVAGGSFNTELNELRRGSASLKLTPIEGKILRLLLTHEGQVLSLESILERIWGYDTERDVSVIKTHIRRLRMKMATLLGDDPIIHTVPGLGYTLRQDHPQPAQRASAQQAAGAS